jgi:hypothetical protein
MSSYRGDGYGQHGDVGDDDYRFGEGRNDKGRGERSRSDGHSGWNEREPEHGSAHGNLMGRAEHSVREFLQNDRDAHDDRSSGQRAADDWNRRFGREGYQGSYGVDPSYRDYRERHLAELDRDYDEWCRDREHQFNRDFGDWRSQRRQVTNQPGDDRVVGGDRAVDRLVSDESSGGKQSRKAGR